MRQRGCPSLPFKITHKNALLFSLLFGFAIRLIPEVLAFPYPIGFDTVSYAARIERGVVWYHWSSMFSTWLLYGILIPIYNATHVDTFLLLKLVGPVLYAVNVGGIYYFARKALRWRLKKALFAAFFFALQLASLRISWDLLRNTLGMGITLFALPFILRLERKREFLIFVVLSVLATLGHEFAAVFVLTAACWLLACWLRKGERQRFSRGLAAVLPMLVLFSIGIYLKVFPITYELETNVLGVGDTVHPSPGPLFFLVNYLEVVESNHFYPTYFDLVLHVSSVFLVLYAPYLILIFSGFFRNRFLDSWILLLLVGAFSSLIVPVCAMISWNRWMVMLVYPLSFYAVHGFGRMPRGAWTTSDSGLGSIVRSRRKIIVMLLLPILLGGFYLATPALWDSGVLGGFSAPNIGLYFSFAPTVLFQDVDDTIETMKWLDVHADMNSCVLVHHIFRSWVSLHLDESHTVVCFTRDAQMALDVALEHRYDPVYLVWWNEDVGLYELKIPSGFVPVFDSGRISAFEYT